MKKIFALILTITLATSSLLFTSCGNQKEDFDTTLKNEIQTTSDTLLEDLNASEKLNDFAKELKTYLKSLDMEAKIVNGSNVIVDIEQKGDAEDLKSTILLTQYSKEDSEESANMMALAITTARNLSENGKVRLIFSPKTDSESIGVEKLDASYLEADNLINLNQWQSTEIFNGAAKVKSYVLEEDLDMSAPKGNLAYKITISNLTKADSADRTKGHTNPIVYISKMLTSSKASGQTIEIASFKSDGYVSDYPTGAEVIVVIDKSSQAKFEKKLASQQESFLEKNSKRDPDATFEYEIVDTPSKVFNYDNTSNILSLLYTLEDGVYETTEDDDKGDILGLCNISKVRIKDKNVKVTILGRTINAETEASMDNTLGLIAELSDFTIKTSDRYQLWEPTENQIVTDGSLLKAFEKNGIETSVEYTFAEDPASILLSKNANLNIVTVGINKEEISDCAKALIDYLQ